MTPRNAGNRTVLRQAPDSGRRYPGVFASLSRRVPLALFCGLALLACEKSPAPAPSAAPPASSIPASAPTPSATAPAGPSWSPGSTEAKKEALRQLLSGRTSPKLLPEHATEPGEMLDPSLRGAVAPRIEAETRFGKITATGGLAPEVVRRILRHHHSRIRVCYENALQRTPELAGTIEIQLSILQDGRTRRVRVRKSDIKDMELRNCTINLMRLLRFPQLPEGATSAVIPIEMSVR